MDFSPFSRISLLSVLHTMSFSALNSKVISIHHKTLIGFLKKIDFYKYAVRKHFVKICIIICSSFLNILG